MHGMGADQTLQHRLEHLLLVVGIFGEAERADRVTGAGSQAQLVQAGEADRVQGLAAERGISLGPGAQFD